MALIAIRDFKGEIPRLPKHLLPDGAAEEAINCDFAGGQLVPLRAPESLGLTTTLVQNVASLFTDTGSYWWVTDANDIRFYKSPVIDEIYSRGYFLWTDGRVKVDTLPTSQFQLPVTTTNAGVPQPTAAPTLTVTTLTTIPGLTSPSWTFTYWYESEGVRYQEATASVSQVTANQEWTFTPAAVDVGTTEAPKTPQGAALAVSAKLTDGSKVIFTLNTSTSASVGARTSALPGGCEMSLSKNTTSGVATIKVSWGPVDTRAYCFTVKNTWGEESAPSPASLVSPTYIQQVNIQITAPSFTGYRARAAGLAGVGIYRTFGGSAEYLSISPSDSGSDLYVDAVHTPANVGTLLRSNNWTPPPTNLNSAVGMHLTPNGWFIAAKGNTLYMSEPYRPHAWPYSITLPKSVRGICVGPQSVVVTTSEATYVVNGPHPASATQQKLSVPVGGVSSRSMAATESGVAIATNDGIMFVNGTNASLAEGQRLFTREAWRNRYGSVLGLMKLVYFDGKLIGGVSQQDAVSSYGFVLRTDENQAAGNLSKSSVPIVGAAIYQSTDALYITGNGDAEARNLLSYGTGNYLTATWKGKEHIFQRPERMGVVYVRFAEGLGKTCTIIIYRDGVQLVDRSNNAFSLPALTASGYYRLPAVGPGLRWQIQIAANTPVYEVLIGHTIEELKGA